MAYTKTEWVTGETPLSADNMNNIENGIADLDDSVSGMLNSGYTQLTGSYGINVFYKKVGPVRFLHFGGAAVGSISTHTFTIVEDIEPPDFYMARVNAPDSSFTYTIAVSSAKQVTITALKGANIQRPYINMTFVY